MDSESMLLDRVRQRDGEALADYVHSQRGELLRFLRSICSDRLLAVVEAEDLLQEVATTAVSSIATAPLDRYEPIAWLQEIARRRVKDAHRYHFKSQRRSASRNQPLHAPTDLSGAGIEAILAASITSPSGAFSRDARFARIEEAVEALPDEHRAAIRLRYIDGLPSKEIATRLGKSDGAVRVLLSRILRSLETLLEDVRPGDR